MYSNIKLYQKYLVTPIKVGYATRSLYGAQVQRLKESRLTIRRDGDQDPVD